MSRWRDDAWLGSSVDAEARRFVRAQAAKLVDDERSYVLFGDGRRLDDVIEARERALHELVEELRGGR